MKKLTLILLTLVMLVSLAACGNKCEHTYDNACDATCNECGEERTVTHDWNAADCTTPKTCKVCGATDGAALGHKPAEDDGDCTTEVKCTVCGAVTTPAKTEHIAHADDGDCTTPVTCTECTTVLTAAKSHDFTGDYVTDKTQHWHVCKNEGCNVTDEKTEHEGGTATCSEQAICTICGNGYGDLLPHNYTYTADQASATITERCANGCGYEVSVKLEAPQNAVYNGNEHPATLTYTGGTALKGATPTIVYLTSDGNAPVNVGNYGAELQVGTHSVFVQHTIYPATPEVTPPTANDLTYNGTAQELVTAGTATGGTLVYSLTAADGSFSETIPTATDAGDYFVYYYVQGDDNHNDTSYNYIQVTIKKATLEEYTTAQQLLEAVAQNGNIELGDTIKLGADIDLGDTGLEIPTGKTVTLDLNGFTLSGSNPYGVVQNDGTLTITDSGVGGKITATGYACCVFSAGTSLIVEDGDFIADNTAICVDMGTVEIKGEAVLSGTDGLMTSTLCTSATVAGGVINGTSIAINARGNHIDISGGSINGLLWIMDEGSISVTGGTFDKDPSDYVDKTTHTVTNNGDTWTVTKAE